MVVQLSGSLLNSTFVQNSELHAYLPEGWEEKLDSLIDNAYTYGREGISTGVSYTIDNILIPLWLVVSYFLGYKYILKLFFG